MSSTPFGSLTDHQIKKYNEDGFLVIENFLTDDDVDVMKREAIRLVRELSASKLSNNKKCFFSTTSHEQAREDYFLSSGDDIRLFYENQSCQEKRDDKKSDIEKHHITSTTTTGNQHQNSCEEENNMNKMGHALHWLNPVFKKVTFSEKIKDIAKSLAFVSPAVVQGMYIFKPPRIGSKVIPHQDSTFLYNDPHKLAGFWMPLDDATLSNGCLWFIRGSHKVLGVSRRFVRTMQSDQKLTGCVSNGHVMKENNQQPAVLMTFEGANEDFWREKFTDKDFVSVPVNKGSLVLIHGQVIHKSEENKSARSRHAYTFHVVEMEGCDYSKRNWLQPTKKLPFPTLYDTKVPETL